MAMEEALQLVKAFEEKGWKSKPCEGMLKIRDRHREQLSPLVRLCMDKDLGGTFVDAALSFLTEEEFRDVVDAAVSILSTNEDAKCANSVVAYASLQFPRLLAPHLETFFKVKPNRDAYYGTWVWREAGEKEIEFLGGQIENSDEETRSFAWDCLLSVRKPDAILEAKRLSDLVAMPMGLGFNEHAKFSGFEMVDGKPRPLFFDKSRHLIFGESFFEDLDLPPWLSKSDHPTWKLEDEDDLQSRFGGEISAKCGCCRNPLHRLVEAPPGLIAKDHPVVLATCMSCLGWEEGILYYRHDSEGTPASMDRNGDEAEPDFPAEPLKPARVGLCQTPSRWSFQDWALSNSRENLNRIGGYPSWIQDADYPDCPDAAAPWCFAPNSIPTSHGFRRGMAVGKRGHLLCVLVRGLSNQRFFMALHVTCSEYSKFQS